MKKNNTKQLTTDQWLVSLDDHQKKTYKQIRVQEDDFVIAAEAAGATVITPHAARPRQRLIIVPERAIPAVKRAMPSPYLYYQWDEILKTAAEEQKKMPTIGDRSALPPTWFNGDGDEVPEYRAKRVSYRTNSAARGAKMSKEAAVSWLKANIDKIDGHIKNSATQRKKSRAARQASKKMDFENDLRILNKYPNNAPVTIQVKSGEAFAATVRMDDDESFRVTVPTIVLIPAVDDVEIVRSRKRDRQTDRIVLSKIIITLHHHAKKEKKK